jgi:hypothetical protein
MPLHVAREQAEEDVGLHVIFRPVPDGPYEQIESFQAPEGPFDLGEVFIGADRVFGGESFSRFARPDHVDAVEGFFSLDRFLFPGKGEHPLSDGHAEVFAHLKALEHTPCFLPDLGLVERGTGSSLHLAGDAGKFALSGVKKFPAFSLSFLYSAGTLLTTVTLSSHTKALS